ncbi:MAG: hydrogenase [Dehalococcoidia bacterium]
MIDQRFLVDTAAGLLVLSSLAMLATSRIATGIRLVAIQGLLLGAIAFLDGHEGVTMRSIALGGGTVLLKSALFPWLLSRAQHEARVQQEPDPFVSYPFSLAGGVTALGVAVWLSDRVTLTPDIDALVVAVGLFTTFAGLLLLVTRRIALGQVLGYIVLENGIATFGLAVAEQQPLLVELGVLLDVFVAVFVMGIAIVHINHEFDHIEVDQLSALRD